MGSNFVTNFDGTDDGYVGLNFPYLATYLSISSLIGHSLVMEYPDWLSA